MSTHIKYATKRHNTWVYRRTYPKHLQPLLGSSLKQSLKTAEAKYPASRLYENYRHYCQVLGRKPRSNSAFKKALDKLVNVYQSRSSSGMQWHGIEPLMRV